MQEVTKVNKHFVAHVMYMQEQRRMEPIKRRWRQVEQMLERGCSRMSAEQIGDLLIQAIGLEC